MRQVKESSIYLYYLSSTEVRYFGRSEQRNRALVKYNTFNVQLLAYVATTPVIEMRLYNLRRFFSPRINISISVIMNGYKIIKMA